ncbi:hypothetical protein J6590_101675 [Homalodisca vitripennis]|nr:hypothetical protein J6590_101675 [Homalodisca vitripennis]
MDTVGLEDFNSIDRALGTTLSSQIDFLYPAFLCLVATQLLSYLRFHIFSALPTVSLESLRSPQGNRVFRVYISFLRFSVSKPHHHGIASLGWNLVKDNEHSGLAVLGHQQKNKFWKALNGT